MKNTIFNWRPVTAVRCSETNWKSWIFYTWQESSTKTVMRVFDNLNLIVSWQPWKRTSVRTMIFQTSHQCQSPVLCLGHFFMCKYWTLLYKCLNKLTAKNEWFKYNIYEPTVRKQQYKQYTDGFLQAAFLPLKSKCEGWSQPRLLKLMLQQVRANGNMLDILALVLSMLRFSKTCRRPKRITFFG